MIYLTTTINLGLLAATLAAALVMIDHMGRGTRGAVRWGAVLLLVGIIAEVFGYVWHWASWTDTMFFGGAAMCLIANLRLPAGGGTDGRFPQWTAEQRAASVRRANLYAYCVGALTMVGLLIAWVFAP